MQLVPFEMHKTTYLYHKREEREAVEWRRRLDGRDRQAKEEMLRLERLFAQTEERLNEQWALEVEKKEAGLSLCLLLCCNVL